ncbi:response regulator [Mucilaginibacter sp. Bleaf8]|uniref:PAS domain-containing hybrid sensor histidine kinase/response regulator n=1 Tax=Mucilaginibacter sp. Bleaf8 TaxID=2834430 RepID=UPI001BD1520B|nr:PAS domain-containing hybrid sensor histidine kinase/response regulator [Mucilaginibacter sp. Bleaf8]MBS7565741.1 response regulator [Mucilaginibacter sp. Bleaf8]
MPYIPHITCDNLTAGYWEWEIGNDKIRVDALLNATLGFEDHELPNKLYQWKERAFADDLTRLGQKFKAHIESGTSVPFVQEVRFGHKAGHTVCMLISGKAITEGNNNKYTKIIGSFLDLTPQKEAEKELRQVKEFLNKTNQTAQVGGWELDLINQKVIWTAITKSIFEVPDDFVPIIGSATRFFKEGYDRDTLYQAYLNAINHGVDYDLELKIITAKGREIWTRSVGHPEFVNGKCVRLYGVFQDIDKHKRNEEQLRIKHEEVEKAAAAKLEFLSIMSHEIRTPLNAVIGFTNLLLQNPRQDQHEYLNVLKFSAENVLILINDILDFNKIEAGKIDIEQVDFDLSQLIKNIYAAQQGEADQKDLQFVLQIDEAVPTLLVGDPVRMGQVINNLIANAIKFTPAGKVELIVKVLEEHEHKVKLYFEVADTGIGIPTNKLEHIFERFSQASSETTRKYGGTGLGLAICKRLLELVNSHLQVTSVEGKGSSFFFELTFKKSKAKQQARTSKPSDLALTGFPGKKVLITEDNPVNVMVIRKFLQQWDITCDVAENGKIALDKASQNIYDLILMDLQMPEMDGYDATVAIRKLSGQYYQELPIIALTASTVADMGDKILQAGMNACVTKPFKPALLHGVLSQYLG